MSYLVLARKYRPQTFETVIGQSHVTETLAHAIAADRVAHALLFAGPRGTGKTTIARIMAKAMNCKQGPSAIPCGVCRCCEEIVAGHSTDVFEIDGASNNSVDQVRELRSNIGYMPAHSRHKIYIIDEVHMLSLSAFNALLKTLEEPPPHVLFMFATTEVHKIPATILSRCQRHDLRRIPLPQIRDHLAAICSDQGVGIDSESLQLIAREASGSMRDGLSLLDQILSSAEGEISQRHVLDILGVVDREAIHAMADALLAADVAVLLSRVADLYRHGYDLPAVYTDLVTHFRNLMLIKMGTAGGDALMDLSPGESAALAARTDSVTPERIEQLFLALYREEPAIRLSPDPRMALEMICIKICQKPPAVAIDTLISKLDQLRTELYQQPVASATAAGEQVAPKAAAADDSGSAPASAAHDTTAALPENEALDQHWQTVCRQIAKTHPALGVHLSGSSVRRVGSTGLAVQISGNDFKIKMVRRPKNLEIIEHVCSRVMGEAFELQIHSRPEASPPPKSDLRHDQQVKKRALEHPLVADAVQMFDGQVVDILIPQEERHEGYGKHDEAGPEASE